MHRGKSQGNKSSQQSRYLKGSPPSVLLSRRWLSKWPNKPATMPLVISRRPMDDGTHIASENAHRSVPPCVDDADDDDDEGECDA